MADNLKWKILSVVLPIGFCAIMVVLLQTTVIQSAFDLKLIQLPKPSDILKALIVNLPNIMKDCAVTLKSVVPGMLLGAMLGFAVAAFAVMLPNVGYGSLTIMTAINSIPVLALAPLMNRWFASSMGSKIAVVTIVCMGAMSVNAFKGFNAIPNFSLDLMKSYACTRRQIFIKLRCPNSIPYVFVAFKTNVATGMIAAIISEFYSTSTFGLGYMIRNCLKVGNRKVIGWAYILVTAVVSIIIYAIICLLEKKFTKGAVLK